MESDGRARAVVPGEQARGQLRGGRFGGGLAGGAHRNAEDALELGLCHGAGPQQARCAGMAEVHDGRFQPDGAGAAVENVADFPTEPGADMRGGGWADIAERIGAGRGEGYAGEFEQASEQRMAGHAHGHAWQAGGHGAGHARFFRQDEGQRAGPEFLREAPGRGVGLGDFRQLGEGMDVDDERIAGGTSLGRENLPAGPGIKGVGGEAVNRLGRHGDEFAGPKQAREPGEITRGTALDAGGKRSRHGTKKAGAKDSGRKGCQAIATVTARAACCASA